MSHFRRALVTHCRWLGLLLLACLASPLQANTRWDALTLPEFRIIERNGRPLEGPVRAIAQDDLGFIWITADGALWRWDGYELEKAGFRDYQASSPQLPEILMAKSDPDGRIWVGTSAGLFQLDQARLLLERVDDAALNTLAPEYLAFDYAGGRKRVYLSSVQSLYLWQDGKAQKLHAGPDDDRIHSLLVSTDGRLWVGSNNGLLVMARDGKPTPYAGLDMRISALHQAGNGTVWVGTAKHGIFRISSEGGSAPLTLPDADTQMPWIYDIHEIAPGQFWFGTFGDGILTYNEQSGEFNAIRKERMLESRLLDNDVWILFRDRTGSMWVGTRTGLNFVNPLLPGLRHMPAGAPGERLSDGLIYSMEALPDGRVVVGTSNQGLDFLDPVRGLDRHLSPGQPLRSGHAPENAVEALLATSDKQLLMGNSWQTLRLDMAADRIEALVAAGRPADADTSDIVQFDGALWLSGTDGLWRIDGENAVNVMAQTPGERRVTRLLADGDSLWIGTWLGLKRLRLRAGTTPEITAVADPLLNQRYINALYRDARGRLWVGTYGGGLLFNDDAGMASGKPWSHIGEQDGLPGNKVTGILSDQQGNIWAGCESGLARIDGATLAVSAILPVAGASAAPYETAVRTADGDLLFGGSRGITVLQPQYWRPVRASAPLVFTAIRDGDGKPMQQERNPHAKGSVLTVPANVNTVSLQFAALDFTHAAHLRYRYRMVGKDGDWRPLESGVRTVILNDPAPGRHALEVAYSLDGKQWSPPLRQTIAVAPSWYEMRLVQALFALLALALLFALQRWWLGRVARRQTQLEQQVSERTAELETANRLLQQQAQAIREASLTDPLTGLHNRRYFAQHIDSEAQLAARRYKTGADQPIEQADLLFFLVDIDQFKRINDRQGHAAGDAVLVEMRQRLQSVFRGSDFLIRWGGEEFLAVARGASRAKAGELAERIRTAVNSVPFHFNGNSPIMATCSIGFAPYPFLCGHPEALNWKETLALADAALYAAKNAGRNAWVGFDGNDQTGASLLSILRASPEAALQSGMIGISRSDGHG